MRSIRAVVGSAVLVALIGAPALFAARSRSGVSDAPTPEWRQGPVRYIITRSEDNEYKDLGTDEDRQRFIESFWRRRDPTPDTPGNEFRSSFWKRVREANGLYGRMSPRPGWLTDMGKIHILFGAPDEIQRDEVAEGRRGIIVWVYRNSPSLDGGKGFGGPNQVIAFADDGSGEYRMTTEPSKVANVWEGLPDPQPAMGPYKFIEARQRAFQKAYASYIGLTDPVIRGAGGPALQSPLGMLMDLGRLQQPPKQWELNSEITTREFFGSLPFRARADFFKTTTQASQVLLNVTVKSRAITYRSTPAGEEPAVEVYGRILDSTGTTLVASLEGFADFAGAPENASASVDDDLVYQARALLAPGAYVARLTVLDAVSGRTGTSDTPFTVPDFGTPALSLSSVALSRKLEPAQAGTRQPPYVIGALRVLPRLGQEFRPEEDLSFYYQVYGAKNDPATGLPRLNVTYIFLTAEQNETAEVGRVSFEGQTNEAHGYSLPLKDWPAGFYLVRIEVEDAVAGTKATRDLLFRVLGS